MWRNSIFKCSSLQPETKMQFPCSPAALFEHNIWAANTVAVIHAYDPEIVVFGGGVTQSADVIQPFVEGYVEKHAWTNWGTPQLCASILAGNAALMGAVPLLSEDFRSM